MVRIVVLLLAILYSGATEAAFENGNRLFDLCGGEYTDIQAWFYVAGTYDAIEMNQTNGFPKLVCVPPDVTIKQLGQTVCKYLAENPEKRHYPSAYLTLGALLKNFPCTSNPSP